jgi:hypothetical protein
MRSVGIALVLIAAPLTAHSQPTPDEIARSLGEMEWHASVCRVPTAPIEAALERLIQRIQAGSLEATHLRHEMLVGRTEYDRTIGTYLNCDQAAAAVADLIAKTDHYRLH